MSEVCCHAVSAVLTVESLSDVEPDLDCVEVAAINGLWMLLCGLLPSRMAEIAVYESVLRGKKVCSSA